MQGMILAAGYGTRLAPLTDNCPKALILLNGKPLLWHVIEKFINSGINEIVINAHFLSEQVIEFIHSTQFKAEIKVVVEKDILGTGGGIFNMLDHISEDDFFVYNTDVVSSANLANLMVHHKKHSPLATMVMQNRETFNQVIIDRENKFCGLKYIKKNSEIIAREPLLPFRILAFCGIHVINKRIKEYKSAENEFSIIKTYLEAAKNNENILSYEREFYWKDVGTFEKLKEAEDYLNKKRDV
ncbi:MAG: NTP transferase domain-containing protein [Candidatus Delongbacteria bacterium]|nr:NTP transferase domain-containing protein [Candidatus Delongbacteria bacterium]